MNFRLFFILALIGACYQLISSRMSAPDAAPDPKTAVIGPSAGTTGFVSMPLPDNAPANKILVIAPPNCPKAAGVRASSLVSQLRSAGIPCELTGNIRFTVATEAEAKRLNSLMNSTLPLVFIRGKARSNPPLADVIAEYRKTSIK